MVIRAGQTRWSNALVVMIILATSIISIAVDC